MTPTMNPGEDRDKQLMTRIAAGDRQAFASFMECYLDAIVHFSRHYVLELSDAEDIAQEAFLRVWQHAGKYQERHGASPRSWLYKLSYNLCMDTLRRRKPGIDVDELVLEADNCQQPEQAALRDARLIQLEQAIAGLNVRQHTAITLCALEGLSNREAASSMGISVEALESLLSRARRKLRNDLQLTGSET